jgi:hypothetical protein
MWKALSWHQADVGSLVAPCSTLSRLVAHGCIAFIGRDHLGQCLLRTRNGNGNCDGANQRDRQQWIYLVFAEITISGPDIVVSKEQATLFVADL